MVMIDLRALPALKRALTHVPNPTEVSVLRNLLPVSDYRMYKAFIASVTQKGMRDNFSYFALVPETRSTSCAWRKIRWCGWPTFSFTTRFGTVHPELHGQKTWVMVFDDISCNNGIPIGVCLGARFSLEQLLVVLYSAEDLLGRFLIGGRLGCGMLRLKSKR